MQGAGRLSAHTDAVVDHVPCQRRAVDEDQPPGGASCRALRWARFVLMRRRRRDGLVATMPSPGGLPQTRGMGFPHPRVLRRATSPRGGGAGCDMRQATTSPNGGGRWPKGHRVGAKPPPLGEVDRRQPIGWGPHRTRPIRRVPPGDTASYPHTSKTCITSSPKWLMTFTAMRPWSGGSKGREVSRWRLLQASSSISAFRAVFRAL